MSDSVSEELLQIINDHPLPWSIYNLDGLLVGANQAVERLFGLPKDTLVGQYNLAADPEVSTNGYLAAFEQAKKGLTSTVPARRFETSDGEVWYEGRIFPNRDQNSALSNISMVLVDVTGQKRAEADLVRRTEEIIQAQQAALRELSTPLIPLADHVVVMPLVGSIDSQRAQLIMETLLEGISTYQADVAILDITGVPVVDTQVADALLRTARAARLLGAQIVLTGIGSHIAQTLITVGADLSGLVTLNNLQSGISYAMQLMNGSSATASAGAPAK
jgi:PAS domain S-box-containing protein